VLVACILWFVYTFLHTCAPGHSTCCGAEDHGHGQVGGESGASRGAGGTDGAGQEERRRCARAFLE